MVSIRNLGETDVKWKVILSFVALTLVTSAFFVVEGYFSARDLSRYMDLKHAHDFLKTVETSDNVKLNDDQYIKLWDGREKGNKSIARIVNLKSISAHRKKEAMHRSQDQFFYNVDGASYLAIKHVRDQDDIIYIKRLELSDAALSKYIDRSVITLSVLFWVCIWFSIYIAVVLSRYIKKNNENNLALAYTDGRTGLKNSSYLYSKVEFWGKSLFVIDIADLSSFEEAFGSHYRDKVLSAFSINIRQYEGPNQIVGYYGLYRFFLVIDNVSRNDFYDIANDIKQSLSTVICANEIEFRPRLVIGISTGNEDTVGHAITAARYARRLETGIAVYSEEIEFAARMRVSYSSELERAVEKDEFFLLYQPKIDITTGAIVGAESLVRWNHPRDGILSPDKFISLVEKSHIASDFTLYILNKVIGQVEIFNKYGFFIPISINAFPFDFYSEKFISRLKSLCLTLPWVTDFIELELVENETSCKRGDISTGLGQLKSLGFTCSIDDFGVGMSSLAYLKDIPVSAVKIDKLFIQDLAFNGKSEVIVKGVLIIAEEMGWTVVAEGVESVEVANKLKDIGVDVVQGYYYSKAVSADALLTLFDSSLNSKYLAAMEPYKVSYHKEIGNRRG